MNSYERVMGAFNGNQIDRVPVILSVSEWCLDQVDYTIEDMMTSAERHSFSQFFCQKQYGYDAVRALSGVHAESEAMGCKLKYSDKMSPSLIEPVIKDYGTDLDRLRVPDPCSDGRLPLVLRGAIQLKELSKRKVPVVANIQAPFRNAAMLRGPENAMRDMLKKPSQLEKVLEIATGAGIIYAQALVRAGADIILMTDPTASGDVISRKHWDRFAYPFTKRLVQSIKGATDVKVILHICGDTADRLDSFATLGIDGMSLDEKVDLGLARKIMGEKFCLMGNVSPTKVLYFGTPDDVEYESRLCIEKAGDDGYFILSAGCVVPRGVSPDNIRAMVKAAEQYGRYD